MKDPVGSCGSSRVRRAYRLLLRLLPFEFRAEFGRDMEQVFSDEQEDVRGRRSRAETLGFWVRTLKDFARTAPREQWDILRQDVGVGARLLARSPGFAAAAILTLALGIGASTGIFSIVHAVVLRPLALPEPDRLVTIGWVRKDLETSRSIPLSYPDLQAIREACPAFEAVGGMQPFTLGPEAGGSGPRLAGTLASLPLFRTLGATVVLGRMPDERDEQPGAAPVVLLSHVAWVSQFGGAPNVIGQTLERQVRSSRGQPATIVGVLHPDAFPYPFPGDTAAWAPFDAEAIHALGDGPGTRMFNLRVYARLAPGASLDAARAQLAALAPRLAADLPGIYGNLSFRATRVHDDLVGAVSAPLLAFLWAVVGLLLVAAVNAGSLMLARSVSRRREFAVRFALGARPLRVARQLLTESALVALAGGVSGLALAWGARRAFMAISPSMPRLDQSRLDASVLGFALGAVALATCVVGLVPAWQSSRRTVVDGLRRASGANRAAGGASRPLSLLSAVELALTLVLLLGAGLLVNSFARLVTFDLGVDPKSVMTFWVSHQGTQGGWSWRASTEQERVPGISILDDQHRAAAATNEELVRRVSAVAGVASAGVTTSFPLQAAAAGLAPTIQIGHSPQRVYADMRGASPSVFRALGMRLVRGRSFTDRDREGAPFVAIVNETMARRFWRGREPIGDHVVFTGRRFEVVGIVADVHNGGARQDAAPAVYVPDAQGPAYSVTLVVRAARDAAGVERAVADKLARMGGRVRAGKPVRLEDVWWKQLSDARFLTLVVSVFTLLALAVALVGVHGVLRFSVVQRTREMGIRKALGATPFDLLSLVVGHALRFALAGCLTGLIAALAAGPAIRSLLFGVTPADPLTLVAATLMLIAAVVVAAWFPARRASAVDPSVSLRCE